MPYDEEYSEFLESEFEKAVKTRNFHKKIDFSRKSKKLHNNQNSIELQNEIIEESKIQEKNITNKEAFVFHSAKIILHFTQAAMLDEYGE